MGVPKMVPGNPWGVTHRVPQRQLPFAHAAEASGEDLAVGQEDGTHGTGPLMRPLLLLGGTAVTGAHSTPGTGTEGQGTAG